MPTIHTNPLNLTPPQPREDLVEKFGGNESASGLPCPMLSALVNEGLLTPDEQGEVTLTQLKSSLKTIGVGHLTRQVLARFGAGATDSLERGVLNLLRLETSRLEHTGSLGPIQDGGFRPEYLEQLKSFSSDGQTLTFDDLAVAQQTRFLQDEAGGRDKLLGVVEITALFLVLGRPDNNGVKSLKLADIERLYRDNRLPEDFKPESVGLLGVAWNSLRLAFMQNFGSAGARAEKGLRDALGESGAIDTTSMLGFAAMCPAGMRPKAGMGATPGEVAKIHSSLESSTRASS